MAQATRELRRRIKGIGNTKKITKAMELVSASKMRHAVNAALATRTYAKRSLELLLKLSGNGSDVLHPLLQERPVQNALVIVFSSDRGLAGGLNAQVIRSALQAANIPDTSVRIVAFGKKAADAFRRSLVARERQGSRFTLAAVYMNPLRQPSTADIRPVARMAIDEFTTKTTDQVVVVWTDYVSAIVQKPVVRQILPMNRAMFERLATEVVNGENGGLETQLEYLFEPSPERVFAATLPRLVEVQLLQALLESTASEHAARMVAMRNATDAANDLIDDLTLTFNQARQAGITQDLAEISASRAALS